MKYTLLLTALFWGQLLIPALASTQDQGIQQVIQTFKSSIEQRDKSSFLSIFVAEDISWHGVISDSTRDLLIRKNPAFASRPKVISSTPSSFIDEIINDKADSEELFSNLRIHSDGEVASVNFAYQMLKDNVLRASGAESWLLVMTKEGWKISAVNFSFNLNPQFGQQGQ